MKTKARIVFLLLNVILLPIYGQIKLPNIFRDNMVLQQGKPVKIWGTSAPDETVIITFQKQTKKTKADASGQWMLELNPLVATCNPQRLTIKGKKNKIVFKNILVGEVWLASGQSNMEYSMNKHTSYSKPRKGDPEYLRHSFEQANNPLIRVLYVEKNLKTDTLPTKGWQIAQGKELAPISAVAYFFAKTLSDSLKIPIGIISSSWGGTSIETWTSEKRFEKMIKPIIPYTLKGFLWYQGEANVLNGDTKEYVYKQKALIDKWRTNWKDSTLSFYYVQLAPYAYSSRRKDVNGIAWDALPKFWEAQTSCLSISRTGMAVTTDLVDNPRDIHPSYKWIVGERLARIALNKNYGKSHIEYSGPTFKSLTTKDNNIILEFDHADSGLTTNDGKAPNWFYIRNKKGKFEKGKATIQDNKIIITHDQPYKPITVRFAWDEIAQPNLINKEGLPAIPFRVGGTE